MIQVKNNSSKRVTFPALEMSIGPHEIKEITDDMASHMLSYPDITKVEEKEDKQQKTFKTRRHYKK